MSAYAMLMYAFSPVAGFLAMNKVKLKKVSLNAFTPKLK